MSFSKSSNNFRVWVSHQRVRRNKTFYVEIDPAKIGLNTLVIVGRNVDPSKLLEISQKLYEFKEICCMATCIGDRIISTEIWAKDAQELTRRISEKSAPWLKLWGCENL